MLNQSRTYTYHPVYYWTPIVLTWLFALVMATLLIVTLGSWSEKVFPASVAIVMVYGMWWQLRRLRRRPSIIRITDEAIIGESRTGEITRIGWEEIDKIDLPPKWEIALDGMPRVILRSRVAGKEFVLGKNLRRYKELAEIIKSHTPQCSHDHL